MSHWVVLTLASILLGSAVAGCAEPAATIVQEVDLAMMQGIVVTAAIVPIAGATVEIEPGGFANVTDKDGAFLVGPLDAGTYRVVVEAPGYLTQAMNVDFGPGNEHVKVVMDATSTDVPYHDVQQFNAYVQCSYAQRFAGVVGGNFNCLGITDLVLGVQVGDDEDHFLFDVNAGGFRGMLVEMVWEEQATMPNWSAYIRTPIDAGGGVGLDEQYWSAVSRSPLVDLVLQGVENSGAYSGDVFHPDQSARGTYEYLVAGMSDTTQPVDVAVALEQELEIFLSTFYHALPGPGYGIIGS